MSGFLRTLAKVGLVELEEDEKAAVAAEEMSDEEARRIIQAAAGKTPDADNTAPEAPARAPEPIPLVDLPPATSIEEGQSFESIYEEARIKPSPFSAEKLIRLLEGLKVMDAATRKTAIKAMDAADDSWTIEDPIVDARRKIAALEAGKQRLDQHVRDAEAKAETDLETQADYQEQATAEIRKQIAELESLLQRELEKVAEERASVQAQLEATRQAARRERARLDAEVARLNEINDLFAPPAQPEPKPGSH